MKTPDAIMAYNYHPITGELLGSFVPDRSPLEPDIPLLPQFSTLLVPPQTGSKSTLVFRSGAWQVVPDWRGAALFSTTDGRTVHIDEVGTTPEDVGATEAPRPTAAHAWQNGKWVESAELKAQLLSKLKSARTLKIRADCGAAITAGFSSAALGAEHHYPSGDTDQRDLLNAALAAHDQPASWTAMLWCATGTPLMWAYKEHTGAQVRQVNADWMVFRQLQQQRYGDLIGMIAAATTEEAVDQVLW